VQATVTLAQKCETPRSENFDEEGFFNTKQLLEREKEVLGLSRDVQRTASRINP